MFKTYQGMVFPLPYFYIMVNLHTELKNMKTQDYNFFSIQVKS
jgi:hypothetical protein